MMKELPAITGGRPVRGSMLPFSFPCIESDDIQAVIKSLKGEVLSMGQSVQLFEQAFASYTGARYAVAVSSGAAGMHIALLAAGIGPQEEIIASPLTHTASTNCILYQKAVPIFTDIDPSTLTLDPEKVLIKISERTKAIIASHYGGFPCNLDLLAKIAEKHGIPLIEDATRSLGAEYKGKMTGRYGIMGVYSFSGLQGVTTGEGGMVVTDDPETCQWLALFRDNGMIRNREKMTKYPGHWHVEMQDLGYNYRMTEMQAALGLSQLEKANVFLKRRKDIANKYNKAFRECSQLLTPVPLEGSSPSWDIYPLRIKPGLMKVSRTEIIEAILKENIGVDVNYMPVHIHPYYIWVGHPDVCTLEGSLCPVAEEVYENLLCLPIYPAMTNSDTGDVISAVTRVINYYSQ
ncbi:MAG: DegT/DnrJ/EryC1/StrS family aminotransferase [Bacillota bacterium]